MALETLNPATLMCVRYLLSGLILIAVGASTGARFPRGRKLWRTALHGVITIGIGTGAVVVAELWVPSATAAMIVTTQPFWMVSAEMMLGGEKLRRLTLYGMAVGVIGTLMLFSRQFVIAGGSASDAFAMGPGGFVAAFAVLQFGACAWAVGSILQRNLKTEVQPLMSSAIQQFATGVAFLIPTFLIPHDGSALNADAWTFRTTGAIVYLALFGGVVGYSSYVYAMERLPVALVSVYTYINPIVAVVLGGYLYAEPFGWRQALAMGVIFVGVAIVKLASAPVRTVSAAE